MFDINRHDHITQRVTERVEVTEKRAPTDESVRLLAEFEKAARDKVVAAIRLENSPIDCVVHQCKQPMTGDVEFVVFLKVNGKRVEVRKVFHAFDLTAENVALGLVDEVSRTITAEVLGPTFDSMVRQLGGSFR